MPVPLFSLDRPLRRGDLATYRTELRELQGNILKGHGRNETASVLLTFHVGQVAKARQFLHARAPRVTSAAEQQDQIASFKATGQSALFTGLWLSADGYRFLGHDVSPFELSFRQGMRQARERLDDPPIARWEEKFRGPIHALLTLAHSDSKAVSAALDEVLLELAGTASVSWEFGHAMRDGSQAFEHFGFVDGVSQPVFFEEDLPNLASRNRWDPSAGPNLVLEKDPLGRSDAECGSYFVFRKLEQNVKGFRRRLTALAQTLGVPPERAGALIMGRFEDGTPIATRRRMNGRAENGFNYGTDPRGHKCPLFSHTRKANPRGQGGTRSQRIARRGITYGPRTPRGGDETGWPEQGVGVLFQCCQASLPNQFETIQVLWANQPNFIEAGVGQDTVVGQRGATRVLVPARWGSPQRVVFDFGEFIRMLGGEYFFAPAKSVLGRL